MSNQRWWVYQLACFCFMPLSFCVTFCNSLCAQNLESLISQSKGLDAIFYRLNCHCIFVLVMKQPLCIQVNEQIIVSAFVLFDCDAFEKKRYPGFQAISRHLKKISGIHCENWDVLKLATAFQIICSHKIGDSDEVNLILCKWVLSCSAVHFMCSFHHLCKSADWVLSLADVFERLADKVAKWCR